MNRRGPTFRGWKAWTLFLLSFVAVGAPVWANTYVCPMQQAALAERAALADPSGCCPKVQSTSSSDMDASRFEPPCDCAQLHWDVADVDSPRPLNFVSPTPLWTGTHIAHLSELLTPVVRLRLDALVPLALSSPPLWVRNQSIRC